MYNADLTVERVLLSARLHVCTSRRWDRMNSWLGSGTHRQTVGIPSLFMAQSIPSLFTAPSHLHRGSTDQAARSSRHPLLVAGDYSQILCDTAHLWARHSWVWRGPASGGGQNTSNTAGPLLASKLAPLGRTGGSLSGAKLHFTKPESDYRSWKGFG